MNNLHKAGSLLVASALLATALTSPPRAAVGLQQSGFTVPITWGDMSARLVEAGVIDPNKFALRDMPGEIVMTEENAAYLLTLLWAFGLANENPILFDPAEMMNPAYAGNGPPGGGFASTGGWTLAKGAAMDHYGMHQLVVLSPQQQTLVDRVSRRIFRPCCRNSAHFPDCNHGMAMLGLLQLAAAEGADEQELYETAHTVNSYWFPELRSGTGCSA